MTDSSAGRGGGSPGDSILRRAGVVRDSSAGQGPLDSSAGKGPLDPPAGEGRLDSSAGVSGRTRVLFDEYTQWWQMYGRNHGKLRALEALSDDDDGD